MKLKSKIYTILIVLLIAGVAGTFIYFKFFFTYEQRNVFKRKIESITGMDLTVTVFD